MFAYLFRTNQKNGMKQSAKTKGHSGRQSSQAAPVDTPPEILVLIDESGDLGSKPDSSRTVTMTASVNRNYPVLGKIAMSHPKNTRYEESDLDELKHHSSSDKVRQDVLKDFMRTSPQIYSVILKKSNFGKMTQAKAYRKMVEEALNDIMEDPNVRACGFKVELIFDEHWAIDDNIVQEMTERAAKRHKLDETIFYARTEPSIDYLPLQVHDFATGAVGGEFNRAGGHNEDDMTNDYKLIATRTKARYISRNIDATAAPGLPASSGPARTYDRLKKGSSDCPRAASQQWTRTDLLSPNELAVRITYIRR